VIYIWRTEKAFLCFQQPLTELPDLVGIWGMVERTGWVGGPWVGFYIFIVASYQCKLPAASDIQYAFHNLHVRVTTQTEKEGPKPELEDGGDHGNERGRNSATPS